MNKKGFGLIEILVAVAIGIVIFSATVGALYYLTNLNSSLRTQALVYQNMSAVMERISSTTLTNLNARYPNGQPLAANEVNNILGGYQVPGEVITVSYPNGTAANPREIRVSAVWLDRGRQRTAALNTFKRG